MNCKASTGRFPVWMARPPKRRWWEKTGPNPTDRGKEGVKRSLLTEGHGVPIGLVVAGANRTDMKLVRATLESIVVERPEPTPDQPQGVCLDKGYDYQEVRGTLAEFGFTGHIRAGEEAQAYQTRSGLPWYGAGWLNAHTAG